MGARSTQVLPAANEVDDAIERVRKVFELQKVRPEPEHSGPQRRFCWSFRNETGLFLQGSAADRFLDNLSGFINGLDTKNNVKV